MRPAAATVPLLVEELEDRGAFATLAPQWEELAARVGLRGPFFSPRWFAVTARHLRGRPRLLVAHRGGVLEAVLPLLAERRRIGGLPARVLRSLSDDHSQRFDLACATDEAARAIVAHLEAAGGWDLLELRDVAQDTAGGATRLVAAAHLRGMPTGTWDAMRSPRLPLPATEAELDTLLGAKFRSNLRRRKKKLEAERGPVALERIDGGPGLDTALDEGFALEAAGWKGQDGLGTAIVCDPILTARYRALAHTFAARGELSLYFLTVGSVRKAFHFALTVGDTYYLFKPGFDPALAAYGPGHLLVDLVARDLVRRGIRELDFLGDDMEWKREWTGAMRPHAWHLVFAPTAYGRALAAWKTRLVPGLRALAAHAARLPLPDSLRALFRTPVPATRVA